MALSVADVKGIVDSKIGGMTLTPATKTIVEGKVVTPQISSVCTLGPGLGDYFAQIDDALKDFMAGLDKYVLNPIKDAYNAAKAAITAAIAYIGSVLDLLDATVQAALALAVAALNAATAALTAIFNHVENMIKDGFGEIMAALSFCSPPKVPSVKKYEKKDLASALEQQVPIDNLRLQASSIFGVLSDTGTSPSEKVTLLNNITANLTNNTTTVNTSVTSDQANLLNARKQNEGLSKLTQMADGLNTDTTKDFVNAIMNPEKASLIQGVAAVMKNPVLS